MAVIDDQGQAKSAGLNAYLLDILVCPVDKQDLQLDGDRLICTQCGRAYPIAEDGTPDMLAHDAEQQ